jgi:hypothetical protein
MCPGVDDHDLIDHDVIDHDVIDHDHRGTDDAGGAGDARSARAVVDRARGLDDDHGMWHRRRIHDHGASRWGWS